MAEHDPLLSRDDDDADDNFLGLPDEAWHHRSSLPLLSALLGIPAGIIGGIWGIARR